jgi:hypothetical protein
MNSSITMPHILAATETEVHKLGLRISAKEFQVS